MNGQYTRETFLQAYHEMLGAMEQLGFSPEEGKLIARELRSEKCLRRMTGYLRTAHPRKLESVADEMLAILEERDTWIRKKQAEEYSGRVNDWLNSEWREPDGE